MDELTIERIAIDLRKEALEKGYSITMATKGMSMFPFIRAKDEIMIKSAALDKLRYGDIILFEASQNSNKLIAHRLMQRIKNDGKFMLITKGDSSLHCDKPIAADTVVGKVVKIKKPYFSIYLESITGRAINLIMLFISLTRMTALGLRALITSKRLLTRQLFYNKL